MSLVLYTFLCIFFYYLAKRKYKKAIRLSVRRIKNNCSVKGSCDSENDGSLNNRYFKNSFSDYGGKKTKMPILMIVVISFGFSIFNYYITEIYGFTSGDRYNYGIQFGGGQTNAISAGLFLLFIFIKAINGNINTLFYFTTFICVFITLYAYRKSRDATPKVLLLFFLSQFIEGTIINIKQAYASAIATIFFIVVLENKCNWKKDLLCIVLSIIAGLFHGTGWILLFIYLIIRKSNRRKHLVPYIMAMFVFILFYSQIMVVLGTILIRVIPRFGATLINYSTPGEEPNVSGLLPAFKGLPFYLITILGLYYKEYMRQVVDNFDTFLLISIISSAMYLMTIYSYWMQRVIYLFFMPNFVLWAQMESRMQNRNTARLCNTLVCLSLAFFTYREYIMIWG